jgi:hypothetical protein
MKKAFFHQFWANFRRHLCPMVSRIDLGSKDRSSMVLYEDLNVNPHNTILLGL